MILLHESKAVQLQCSLLHDSRWAQSRRSWSRLSQGYLSQFWSCVDGLMEDAHHDWDQSRTPFMNTDDMEWHPLQEASHTQYTHTVERWRCTGWPICLLRKKLGIKLMIMRCLSWNYQNWKRIWRWLRKLCINSVQNLGLVSSKFVPKTIDTRPHPQHL